MNFLKQETVKIKLINSTQDCIKFNFCGIYPFFLKDYKTASFNYNMKSCSKAIEIVYSADLKCKGINSNENISKHILVDLINEIFEL